MSDASIGNDVYVFEYCADASSTILMDVLLNLIETLNAIISQHVSDNTEKRAAFNYRKRMNHVRRHYVLPYPLKL